MARRLNPAAVSAANRDAATAVYVVTMSPLQAAPATYGWPWSRTPYGPPG